MVPFMRARVTELRFTSVPLPMKEPAATAESETSVNDRLLEDWSTALREGAPCMAPTRLHTPTTPEDPPETTTGTVPGAGSWLFGSQKEWTNEELLVFAEGPTFIETPPKVTEGPEHDSHDTMTRA